MPSNDKLIFFIMKLIANILKSGPIPEHIGIIMDGNRRFAKRKNMKVINGHHKGYRVGLYILKLLRYLAIKEATIFLFSIENFHRSREEVEGLFTLFKFVMEDLLENAGLMEKGIRIRVIGNLKLLSQEMLDKIEHITSVTKNNNVLCINFAIAYTSRDEITSAIQSTVVQTQQILTDKIEVTEDMITSQLYTNSKVDLMIRTSGEVRLSDFLLWQSTDAILSFTDVLWPDLSPWNFIEIILNYQKDFKLRKNVKLQ